MGEFQDNGATQLAEESFASLDYEHCLVPGEEYIRSLDMVKTFYDYTYEHAKRNGFCGEKEKADALAKFVSQLGASRGIALPSMNTIKNWLKNAPPAGNQAGRENVYALCFALGLDATQTKEFFLKA